MSFKKASWLMLLMVLVVGLVTACSTATAETPAESGAATTKEVATPQVEEEPVAQTAHCGFYPQ